MKFKSAETTTITTCMLIVSSIAGAAETENAPELQEIVVTATKTGATSAQSAPFTLQAIGQDAIAQGKIQGFDDYSKLIPGLASLDKGPDQTQIMIRGITAGRVSHAEPQNQSTSGMYIDETPVSDNGYNPDLDLFDVNRIEVLKGPQGTLYGAGAESGAIRIITNDVDLTGLHGAAAANGSTIDGGGAGYGAHLMINAPVTDQAGLRGTVYYDHEGGFITNKYTYSGSAGAPAFSGQSNYNDYSTWGARLKGLWQISDQLSVRATVLDQRLVAHGRPQMFGPGNPAVDPPGFAAPGESFAINGNYQTVKFGPDPFDDQFFMSSVLVEYDWNSLKFFSSTSFLNRTFENRLDDTYRTRLAFGTATQLDGVTPLDSVNFDNNTGVNDIAQEFRVTQHLDNGLSWVGGLYYEHHDLHFVQSDVTPGLDAIVSTYGVSPSVFGSQPNSVYDGVEADKQQQIAGFGEVTVPLAKRWELVAGLRYFHYKLDSFGRGSGIANDGVTTVAATTAESGNTPKVGVTYRPTDAATVYLQAAKGYRLGGIDETVPTHGVFGTNCGADLAAVGLATIPKNFKSDHLWSYELGAKTSWLNHRLTVNVAVFDIEWDNVQTNIFLPCAYIVVVNAGKARSRGAETEISWAATAGLTLSASAAYTDATLVNKTIDFAAEVGDRLPNVPKVNGAAQAEYRWNIGSDRSVFTNASVAYNGSSYTEFQSLVTAQKVPASASVDGSLGLNIGAYTASFYVKNAANRLIVTGVDTDRRVPVTYTVAPPRTFGLELRAKF
jgi:iron complex outermembrane recepter protein